jgi:tRNA pseudouridine synthase C
VEQHCPPLLACADGTQPLNAEFCLEVWRWPWLSSHLYQHWLGCIILQYRGQLVHLVNGTMWLQFIFIPRVNSIIAERGQFPKSSSVGAQAVREFDGVPEASRLVSLLSEFDAMF